MTLTTDDISCLRRQIRNHEGFMPHAYQDAKGLWTIGFGRMIDKTQGGGITIDEGYWLLDNDLDRCDEDLKRFDWYEKLAGPRKHALLEMRFQLGGDGFRAFRKMLAAIPMAIETGDWTTVASEALDSKWAREDSPKRASEIADQLRVGSYP